jgi:hypothetical protein
VNTHAVAPVPSYTSQAQRLIALTALNQAMLTVAEAEQWDRLAELEDQRAGVLAELFADAFYVVAPGILPPATLARPCTSLDDAALIPVLTQTFSINQRIVTMLEQAQQICQADLMQLGVGRRAQQAYGENRD